MNIQSFVGKVREKTKLQRANFWRNEESRKAHQAKFGPQLGQI